MCKEKEKKNICGTEILVATSIFCGGTFSVFGIDITKGYQKQFHQITFFCNPIHYVTNYKNCHLICV